MEFWLISAVLCGAFGFLIGRGVERPGMGALLGFLFGPLGLILILLFGLSDGSPRRAPSRRRVSAGPVRVPCPMCKEMIIKGAAICPHCRSELTWPEVHHQVVRSGGRTVKRRIVIKRG